MNEFVASKKIPISTYSYSREQVSLWLMQRINYLLFEAKNNLKWSTLGNQLWWCLITTISGLLTSLKSKHIAVWLNEFK